MIFLMRSPLHFLVSHSVLVLYVFGTKTGKLYRIPVSFFEHRKGLLTCVTDKPNIWWKNLKEEKEIKIVFKGKEIKSKINIEPENFDYILPKLNALFTHSRIDGFFGKKIVKKIISSYKKPKVITINNLFANVDNLNKFTDDLLNLIDDDGSIIIETS